MCIYICSFYHYNYPTYNCYPAELLEVLLSLYMQDTNTGFPSPKEVLLCDENTSAEQVKVVNCSTFALQSGNRQFDYGQAQLLMDACI